MYPYSVYFGGQSALVCVLVALASFVVQSESNESRVQVAKNHEFDSCGVTSSALPIGQVRPFSYHLMLNLDFDASKFAGMLEISLKMNKATNRILLNADETLDIEEIWYRDFGRISEDGNDGERKISIKSACLNTQRQILVLDLEQTLGADTLGLLNFAYLGRYSENTSGLFKMEFEDKGRPRRVIQSELEPRPEVSVARKVFPCFDDPSMAAFVELEVGRDASFQVRSNSQPESDTEMLDGTGRKLIKFKRTESIAPQHLYLTLTN